MAVMFGNVRALQTTGISVGGGTFTGPVLFPDGSVTAPSIAFSADTNTGIYRKTTDQLGFCAGGTKAMYLGASPDTGTALFGVGQAVWLGNDGFQAGRLGYDGVKKGYLELSADGTAGSTTISTGTAGALLFLSSFSGTDFSRMMFGGTTSSYPALKRNGTDIDVRLADDSSYTALNLRYLRAYEPTSNDLYVAFGTDTAPHIALSSDACVQWNSTTSIASAIGDTSLNRVSAGVVRVGTGNGVATAGSMLMQTAILTDGVTAPSATAGQAKIYVDTADGDLKVIFGDGTIKTIVVDT